MIQIEHFTKKFGSVTAVDDLSVTVEPGRVTGLLGPNGAGKTTTMSAVLGLQRPTSGRALIAGQPYESIKRPLHQVGALLDPDAVHPSRTARAHLTWIAQSNKIARQRVDDCLGLVGLEPVADRRVRTYSLGMKQRLGIAQALLGDAPVLIFDESTNGLDPEGIQWLRGFLRQLAVEGRTVLLSSHLMGEMSLTAHHLIVIGRGRLLADASLADFIAEHTHAEVIVRTPSPEHLAERLRAHGATVSTDPAGQAVQGLTTETVGDIAAQAGIVIHELRTRTATLEDAYMAITRESVQFGRQP